jgi:hypothetical protein
MFFIFDYQAEIAQLVEHQFPKLKAAGSNPVFRSTFNLKLLANYRVRCTLF